jgi:hypothetical protein
MIYTRMGILDIKTLSLVRSIYPSELQKLHVKPWGWAWTDAEVHDSEMLAVLRDEMLEGTNMMALLIMVFFILNYQHRLFAEDYK